MRPAFNEALAGVDPAWCRRAQPCLGTLVEVGVRMPWPQAGLDAAWRALAVVQARMSVFEADSDLGRSHALPAGTPVPLHPWTAEVLQHAQALHTQTAGLFDVAQGSGRWRVQPALGAPHGDALVDPKEGANEGAAFSLVRLDEATRLDLGGIAKGFAVDRAVQAALAAGAQAVWVNAGGDVRVHGASLAVSLRDEQHGGVRPWLTLEDGAVATSDFTLGARARLHAPGRALGARHVSVAAPQCMLADALTKVVAAVGRTDDPMVRGLLALHGAQAWSHDGAALIA